MRHEDIRTSLEHSGTLIINGHFVYSSGLHGGDYLKKRSLFSHPMAIHALGNAIAELAPEGVDVVVGPEKGGMLLAPWVAHFLGNGREVGTTFAEREEKVLLAAEEKGVATIGLYSYNRKPGDEILVRHPRYVLKYEAADLVRGKKVLVVNDIATSGNVLRATIEAVRACGGDVIGISCICNRGGITAEDLGVSSFTALVDLSLGIYTPEDCPQCKAGVPVNTDLGYGQAFLDRRVREEEACKEF